MSLDFALVSRRSPLEKRHPTSTARGRHRSIGEREVGSCGANPSRVRGHRDKIPCVTRPHTPCRVSTSRRKSSTAPTHRMCQFPASCPREPLAPSPVAGPRAQLPRSQQNEDPATTSLAKHFPIRHHQALRAIPLGPLHRLWCPSARFPVVHSRRRIDVGTAAGAERAGIKRAGVAV